MGKKERNTIVFFWYSPGTGREKRKFFIQIAQDWRRCKMQGECCWMEMEKKTNQVFVFISLFLLYLYILFESTPCTSPCIGISQPRKWLYGKENERHHHIHILRLLLKISMCQSKTAKEHNIPPTMWVNSNLMEHLAKRLWQHQTHTKTDSQVRWIQKKKQPKRDEDGEKQQIQLHWQDCFFLFLILFLPFSCSILSEKL